MITFVTLRWYAVTITFTLLVIVDFGRLDRLHGLALALHLYLVGLQFVTATDPGY